MQVWGFSMTCITTRIIEELGTIINYVAKDVIVCMV